MEFLKKAAGFLVILALLGGMGWAFGPDLLQDYKVRNEQTVLNTNFTVNEAECRSKLFIVSLCTIELQDTQTPSLKHYFYYLIFSNMGGEPLSILNIQGQEGVYTTNIGREYFMNRAISFLGVFGFFVLCLFGILLGGRKA